MKRIIATLAALLLMGSAAFAQVGIEVGWTNSTKISSTDGNTSTGGFFGGLSLTMPIYQNISLVPAVYYSYIDYKDASSSPALGVEEHYVTVPLQLKFTIPLTDQINFFILGGPRFACGILSRDTRYTTVDKKTTKEYLNNNYTDNNDYSRYDLQLGVGGGFEVLTNIQLKATYNWGMLNRYMGTADTVLKRNGLELSAAILF